MSLVGRHIGRYRILEQLGQGGMSVVYKGFDTSLDREVAVKVLHSHLAGKEESRRRLAREAKAVAKLHHPNILEIYDFAAAEHEEQAYIVTEYIRGQTLRQYAEASGFEPPEIAAMVIHEIASALAQAHESGIIHRDLKPENVMVREDGVLKLMDFGIAKIIDRDDKMTMTGALVGSPAHMAPEIIEGEEAGPEADVFSLGTMLYYFATGRLPFTAPNTTATLKRILDAVYDDPRQLVPTVSDDLAEIIATCLARQPSSRYSNAVKLRDALHEYLTALGLGRTTEELQAFFADSSGYRKALVPRLSAALLKRGEALIAEKRPAKALSALNQILAHDPSNARALELLSQMNAARKKQRANALWKRAAVIATGIAVVAGGAVPVVRYVMGSRSGTSGGVVGPTGPSGTGGATGASGSVGVSGIAGASGSNGSVGTSGIAGIGATGSSGAVGTSGNAGVGATGSSGSVGTSGIAGATSASGAVGASGIGAQGSTGAVGPSGVAGASGRTGASGAKGSTGAIAAVGERGSTGSVIKKVNAGSAGTNLTVAKADGTGTAKLAVVPLTVRVRPYGYVEVDGGPRSAEINLHQLQLTPGDHVLHYGCDKYCVTGSETLHVTADMAKDLYIGIEPLPSKLRFDVTPAQAHVRIADVTRTAAETSAQPFVITSPKGPVSLQHVVRYEIFLPGYKSITETARVTPGETMAIQKSLQPE